MPTREREAGRQPKPLMPHVNALPSEMCANTHFSIHKVAHSHLATLPPRSDLKQSILMLIFQNVTLEERLTSKFYSVISNPWASEVNQLALPPEMCANTHFRIHKVTRTLPRFLLVQISNSPFSANFPKPTT